MTVTGNPQYPVDAAVRLQAMEKEILDIERHSQLIAVRLHKTIAKLDQVQADARIIEMALDRMIDCYREHNPVAPLGREEFMQWLEEGDD